MFKSMKLSAFFLLLPLLTLAKNETKILKKSGFKEQDVVTAVSQFEAGNLMEKMSSLPPPHKNISDGILLNSTSPPMVHGFKPVYSDNAEFIHITTAPEFKKQRKPGFGPFKKKKKIQVLPTTPSPNNSTDGQNTENNPQAQNFQPNNYQQYPYHPNLHQSPPPPMSPFSRFTSLFMRPQHRPNYPPPNFMNPNAQNLPAGQNPGQNSPPGQNPGQNLPPGQNPAQNSQIGSSSVNSPTFARPPLPPPNYNNLNRNRVSINNYLQRISNMFSRSPQVPGYRPYINPNVPMYPNYYPLNSYAPGGEKTNLEGRRRKIKNNEINNNMRRNSEFLTGRPRATKDEEKPETMEVKLHTGIRTESRGLEGQIGKMPIFLRFKRDVGYRMPGIFGMDGKPFYLDKDPNTGDITFTPDKKSIASNEVETNGTEESGKGKNKKPMPIIIHSYSSTKSQGQRRPINQKLNLPKKPTFFYGNRSSTLAPPRLPSFYPKIPSLSDFKNSMGIKATSTSTTTTEKTTTTEPSTTTTTQKTTTTEPSTTSQKITTEGSTRATYPPGYDPYLPFELLHLQNAKNNQFDIPATVQEIKNEDLTSTTSTTLENVHLLVSGANSQNEELASSASSNLTSSFSPTGLFENEKKDIPMESTTLKLVEVSTEKNENKTAESESVTEGEEYYDYESPNNSPQGFNYPPQFGFNPYDQFSPSVPPHMNPNFNPNFNNPSNSFNSPPPGHPWYFSHQNNNNYNYPNMPPNYNQFVPPMGQNMNPQNMPNSPNLQNQGPISPMPMPNSPNLQNQGPISPMPIPNNPNLQNQGPNPPIPMPNNPNLQNQGPISPISPLETTTEKITTTSIATTSEIPSTISTTIKAVVENKTEENIEESAESVEVPQGGSLTPIQLPPENNIINRPPMSHFRPPMNFRPPFPPHPHHFRPNFPPNSKFPPPPHFYPSPPRGGFPFRPPPPVGDLMKNKIMPPKIISTTLGTTTLRTTEAPKVVVQMEEKLESNEMNAPVQNGENYYYEHEGFEHPFQYVPNLEIEENMESLEAHAHEIEKEVVKTDATTIRTTEIPTTLKVVTTQVTSTTTTEAPTTQKITTTPSTTTTTTTTQKSTTQVPTSTTTVRTSTTTVPTSTTTVPTSTTQKITTTPSTTTTTEKQITSSTDQSGGENAKQSDEYETYYEDYEAEPPVMYNPYNNAQGQYYSNNAETQKGSNFKIPPNLIPTSEPEKIKIDKNTLKEHHKINENKEVTESKKESAFKPSAVDDFYESDEKLPNILPQFRPNANVDPRERLPLFGEGDKIVHHENVDKVPEGPVELPQQSLEEYEDEEEEAGKIIEGLKSKEESSVVKISTTNSPTTILEIKENVTTTAKTEEISGMYPPALAPQVQQFQRVPPPPPPQSFLSSLFYKKPQMPPIPPPHLQGIPFRNITQQFPQPNQNSRFQNNGPNNLYPIPPHMQQRPQNPQFSQPPPPFQPNGQFPQNNQLNNHPQQNNHPQNNPLQNNHMQNHPQQNNPQQNNHMQNHPQQNNPQQNNHMQNNPPQNNHMQNNPLLNNHPNLNNHPQFQNQPPHMLPNVPQQMQGIHYPGQGPPPFMNNFPNKFPKMPPMQMNLNKAPSPPQMPPNGFYGDQFAQNPNVFSQFDENGVKRAGGRVPIQNGFFRPPPQIPNLDKLNLNISPTTEKNEVKEEVNKLNLEKDGIGSPTSSEEVIYVTQEELEKLKANGQADEFVEYSDEVDDKQETIIVSSTTTQQTERTTERPTTTTQISTTISSTTSNLPQTTPIFVNYSPFESSNFVSPSPIVPIQNYYQNYNNFNERSNAHTQFEESKNNNKPVDYEDLITIEQVKRVDTGPRDIIVKSSFSHAGNNKPNAQKPKDSGWTGAVEKVDLDEGIKFMLPGGGAKATGNIQWGGFSPIS